MTTANPVNPDFGDPQLGLSAVSGCYDDLAGQGDVACKALAGSVDILAQKLGILRARHEAQLKAAKGRFNLFTALLAINDETSLHSKWLAYLLNPKSPHDCGPLFLKLLLETLTKGVQPHEDEDEPDHLELLKGFDCESAKVRSEADIGTGRLDIRIDCLTWGTIAIENKIWAGEQLLQIHRYATHLTEKTKNRKFLLLFLTLDGKQSTTAGDLKDKYFRISYRDHVLPWLEECMRATYRYINIGS